jgi:glycerol-3-phosphate dehydrogenase
MVSIACLSEDHAEKASSSFISHGSAGLSACPWRANKLALTECLHLHSYRGNDPIGIELAGALKNVYAIASGMADGLGYENNTRASQSTSLALGILNVALIMRCTGA